MDRFRSNLANKECDYYKNISDGYHDSSPPLFASHLTYTDPIHKDNDIKWDYPAQIVGQKICSFNVHLCLECQNPILIYGRLMPCRHVLCFDCVNKLIKHSCTRCKEKVQRIEKIHFNQMHLCIQNVNAKPGQTPDLCFKGYLTLEDLKAHIHFRHQQPVAISKPLMRDLKVSSTSNVMSTASPTLQQLPTFNNTSTHISSSGNSYPSWRRATLSTMSTEASGLYTKRPSTTQHVQRQNSNNTPLQSSITTNSIPALLSLTFTPPHEYQQQGSSSSHNYSYNQMSSTVHPTVDEPLAASKRKRKSPTPTNHSDEVNIKGIRKRASLHANIASASPTTSPYNMPSTPSHKPPHTNNNFTPLTKVVEGHGGPLPFRSVVASSVNTKKVSRAFVISSAGNTSIAGSSEVPSVRKLARVNSSSTLPSPTPASIKVQDQPKINNYQRDTPLQSRVAKNIDTSCTITWSRPSTTTISSSNAYIALLEPPPPPPILPTVRSEINHPKPPIPPPPLEDKSDLPTTRFFNLASSHNEQADLTQDSSTFTRVAMKQLISCLPPPPPPPIIDYAGEDQVRAQITLEEPLGSGGTYYKDVDPAALLLLNLSAAACGPIAMDEEEKIECHSVAPINSEAIVTTPVNMETSFASPLSTTTTMDNGVNSHLMTASLDDDNGKEEILEVVNNDSPQAPYVTTLVREISEKSQQNTPYFPINVLSVTNSSSSAPGEPSHQPATIDTASELVNVGRELTSFKKGDIDFNQRTSTHQQGVLNNGAYHIDNNVPLSLDPPHSAYPPPPFDKYHPSAALAYSPFQMYPPYHSPYQAAAYSQYLLSKKAFERYSNNGFAPPLHHQLSSGQAPHNGFDGKTSPDLPSCTGENIGRTAITHNSSAQQFVEGHGYQSLDYRETTFDPAHAASGDEIQSTMDSLVYNPPRFLTSFPPNLPHIHPHNQHKYSPYSSLLQQQHHQGSPYAMPLPQYLLDKYMASHGTVPLNPIAPSPLSTSEALAYQHHLPPHLYPTFPHPAAYYRFPHMTPPSHVMGLGELPPPSYAEQLNMMALANQPNKHPPP